MFTHETGVYYDAKHKLHQLQYVSKVFIALKPFTHFLKIQV